MGISYLGPYSNHSYEGTLQAYCAPPLSLNPPSLLPSCRSLPPSSPVCLFTTIRLTIFHVNPTEEDSCRNQHRIDDVMVVSCGAARDRSPRHLPPHWPSDFKARGGGAYEDCVVDPSTGIYDTGPPRLGKIRQTMGWRTERDGHRTERNGHRTDTERNGTERNGMVSAYVFTLPNNRISRQVAVYWGEQSFSVHSIVLFLGSNLSALLSQVSLAHRCGCGRSSDACGAARSSTLNRCGCCCRRRWKCRRRPDRPHPRPAPPVEG